MCRTECGPRGEREESEVVSSCGPVGQNEGEADTETGQAGAPPSELVTCAMADLGFWGGPCISPSSAPSHS